MFNRDNGPYFQNEIEKVPFESRQVKKSPILREYDIISAMKPIAKIIVGSSLAISVTGCDIAGGISDEYVVNSLSRYVSEHVARQIVNDDKSVPPDTLSELAEKQGIGYDEMTILLLHTNFPQKKKSELIRRGKSAHYLDNASSSLCPKITDDDVVAMLEARGVNEYILRQTLECRGLSPDSYRAVYRKWLSHASHTDLKDNRFLVASANLPTDVREDFLDRLSGVPIASFILREHKRLSGCIAGCASDAVEYMHVTDEWKRNVSFYVRCDLLNGVGSLYEFVAKSKHYATLEELGKDVCGKRLLKVSDVGRCSMEYKIH